MSANKLKGAVKTAAGTVVLGAGAGLLYALQTDAVRTVSNITLEQSDSIRIDPNTIVTFIGPAATHSGPGALILQGVTSQFNNMTVFGGTTVLQNHITEQIGTVKVTLEALGSGPQAQAILHLAQLVPPEAQATLLVLAYAGIVGGAVVLGSGIGDLKNSIRNSTKLRRLREVFRGKRAAEIAA